MKATYNYQSGIVKVSSIMILKTYNIQWKNNEYQQIIIQLVTS